MSNFNRIEFWLDPINSRASDALKPNCRPEFYLDLVNVTTLIVSTLERYAKKTDSILEIGCGTGRNLVALKKAGFENVSGIEISPKTVAVGQATFPEYANIPVTIAPVEDVIESIEPVDVIYTQGCLMHLPFELDWVLERISQKARKVILTNEGELTRGGSIHAWLRDYRVAFESLGWIQVEMETGEKYPPLLPTTIKRVFLRD